MKPNPYQDMFYIDRRKEIEYLFEPTLEDVKNDPAFYAELVNDLLYHWRLGTRETDLMIFAWENLEKRLDSR